MKRFAMAITLSCVLSSSALAGEIPMTGPVPPPPPQGMVDSTSPGEIPMVPGDIPSDGVADQLSIDALFTLMSAIGW